MELVIAGNNFDENQDSILMPNRRFAIKAQFYNTNNNNAFTNNNRNNNNYNGNLPNNKNHHDNNININNHANIREINEDFNYNSLKTSSEIINNDYRIVNKPIIENYVAENGWEARNTNDRRTESASNIYNNYNNNNNKEKQAFSITQVENYDRTTSQYYQSSRNDKNIAFTNNNRRNKQQSNVYTTQRSTFNDEYTNRRPTTTTTKRSNNRSNTNSVTLSNFNSIFNNYNSNNNNINFDSTENERNHNNLNRNPASVAEQENTNYNNNQNSNDFNQYSQIKTTNKPIRSDAIIFPDNDYLSPFTTEKTSTNHRTTSTTRRTNNNNDSNKRNDSTNKGQQKDRPNNSSKNKTTNNRRSHQTTTTTSRYTMTTRRNHSNQNKTNKNNRFDIQESTNFHSIDITEKPTTTHNRNTQNQNTHSSLNSWDHTKRKRISQKKYEEYIRRVYGDEKADRSGSIYRIDELNGREIAEPGQYPHMSAIGFRTTVNTIEWQCGGSLIAENFIITAAHCTEINGQKPTYVKLGDIDLKIKEDDVDPQRLRVKNIYKYPNYTKSSYYNDIALIELASPAIFTEQIYPIRLWESFDIPYKKVFAMGYGATAFGKAKTNILTHLNLTLVSNLECNRNIPKMSENKNGIVESQLCAIDAVANRDTCQGDSGGPLQLNMEGVKRIEYQLIGITSFGVVCGGSHPSVYTRVSSYLDWIENIVWAED